MSDSPQAYREACAAFFCAGPALRRIKLYSPTLWGNTEKTSPTAAPSTPMKEEA